MQELLKRFYAVTVSGSLYEISDEISEKNWPTVRKLAGQPNPDMPVGTHMRNGKFVGISDMGICLFNPHPKCGRKFEHMNIVYWGGTTSGISALFLDRISADSCLASSVREPFSEPYRNETREVLRRIGF